MERYYFNTDMSHELSQRIVNMINGARVYIKTGNFFFRETSIIDALKSAAKRGVAVFVLSNLQGADLMNDTIGFNSKQNDPHLSNLSELAICGIHVKCLNELHAKFLIADGEAGLVMSANYTYDSLQGNPENGVEINGAEVNDLERVFDTAYTYADIKLGRNESGYIFNRTKKPVPLHAFDNLGRDSRLLMTLACKNKKKTNFGPCNVHTLYDAIVKAVDNAQRSITILSYSYVGLDKMQRLHRALINAVARGVEIKLFYRNDEVREKVEEWENELNKLITKGAAVKIGIEKNHAKCILTERDGLMFTANINPLGMKTGFELGIRLTDNQRLQALEALQEYIASHDF